MINGIFFNASGVFYRRTEHTSRYVLGLLQQRGYPTKLAAAEEARLGGLKERASGGWITPQIYWDEFLKAHAVADPAKRADLIRMVLAQVNEVVAQPGAHETVKQLKERGFILGLVTDSMYPIEWKMSWLAAAGVAEYMDVVASSKAVRASKPHPSLYWIALNQAGLTPRQAACVAPNGKELEGARRVGMVTVGVLCDPGTVANYYAATLPDLLGLPIFRR